MDREKHGKVIRDFLRFLNRETHGYVLKGGTALMSCYGLDRFSEDIDLDCKSDRLSIIDITEAFCKAYGYSFRIAKDTDVVKRCMIHYDEGYGTKPLKVEVSYRKREIPDREVVRINGITVYNIDTLASLKCSAYTGRDKIRDLYDVTFIIKKFLPKLSDQTFTQLQSALEYKGFEHVDYLVSNQNDDLIDKDKLLNDFLEAYDDLDLITEDTEFRSMDLDIDDR